MKPTLPLLAVSFFAADVQAAAGPFLGIYLQAHGWTPETIGTVLTMGAAFGLACIAARPYGTRATRAATNWSNWPTSTHRRCFTEDEERKRNGAGTRFATLRWDMTMKNHGEAMKPPHVLVWGTIACVAVAASLPASAQAQTNAHPPAPPRVMPPAAAPGMASDANPDNMPVKKPKGPATHDKMMRSDPASDAQAK